MGELSHFECTVLQEYNIWAFWKSSQSASSWTATSNRKLSPVCPLVSCTYKPAAHLRLTWGISCKFQVPLEESSSPPKYSSLWDLCLSTLAWYLTGWCVFDVSCVFLVTVCKGCSVLVFQHVFWCPWRNKGSFKSVPPHTHSHTHYLMQCLCV